MRADKRVRRTRINTASASAASIGRGHVGSEFERSQNHSQKQPRTHLLIHDAGIFPLASDTGILGQHSLNYRPGIHIAPTAKFGIARISFDLRFKSS